MNTNKTVLSIIDKLKPAKKSVELSIIDDVASEYQAFQDAYDDASFLAYEYGDQVIDAYDKFRMEYPIDNFVVNGNARFLDEISERMSENFNKLEQQAEELGIDPETILPSFYDLKQWLSDAPQLIKDAKDKYREVTDYTGAPNFWN